MRYPYLVLLIAAAAYGAPRATVADSPITVQHAGGQRYVLVPNNWRLRMVTNRLQEAADEFAASHDLVSVQIANERLRIPRAAFAEAQSGATAQSAGIQRWNENTKSYEPFNGTVDPRYLPFDEAGPNLTHAERNASLAAEYFVYGLTPIFKPLAHAGQGLFNDPQNDVWIRDAKGITYFLDGNEWEQILKILASEGHGDVPSVKPDLLDIQKKNRAARIGGIAKTSLFGVVAVVALVFALRPSFRRRSERNSNQPPPPAKEA